MSETTHIGHLQVDSPWGNAGGVVRTPEEAEIMARTGVGWIEAGSYTLEEREGNSPNGETVYVHDPVTGSTWNSLGMPNKGMDEVEKEIPEMARMARSFGKPLVVNVAPVTDNPVEEAQELVARAYAAGADAVLLNAGCPNVITEGGGRHEILSHNPLELGRTLTGLGRIASRYNRIFVRLSPIEDTERLKDIVNTVRFSGIVSTIFTPNTWGGSKPPAHLPQLEVDGNVGGLSGPATAQEAWGQAFGTALLAHDLGIVSSGGITTGQELNKRLTKNPLVQNIVAGAGTTFFHESGDWKRDTDKLLRAYASPRGKEGREAP